MEIGAKGDAEFAVNAIFDRVANAPKGRDGGAEGAGGWVGLNDPNGTVLRTKGFQVIPKGRRLLLKLPGGGGMGDPKARDPELVKRDVADGLITAHAARDVYGVEVK